MGMAVFQQNYLQKPVAGPQAIVFLIPGLSFQFTAKEVA